MQSKKIVSLALATLMIGSCCAGALAESADFGGTTSGGTKGTMLLDGYICTAASGAYHYEIGMVQPNASDPYTLSITGTLTGTNPITGDFQYVTPHTPYRFSSSSPYVSGNLIAGGEDNTHPPNGVMGAFYDKAVLAVSYSSANYGAWQGNGALVYQDLPHPPPAAHYTTFSGLSSGGSGGTAWFNGYLGTPEKSGNPAYYYEIGADKQLNLSEMTVTSQVTGYYAGTLFTHNITPSKHIGTPSTSQNYVKGTSMVYGSTELPADNTMGYRYIRTVLNVGYANAAYGSWQTSTTLEYPNDPPAPVTDRSVTFGGMSSGGEAGRTLVDGYLGTSNTAAFYYEVGVANQISSSFNATVSGHLVGYCYGQPIDINAAPTRTFGPMITGSHVSGDVMVYGDTTDTAPSNNSYGFQYQRADLTVSYTSAKYGTWQGTVAMNYY